jgi:hypothetical protein
MITILCGHVGVVDYELYTITQNVLGSFLMKEITW